MSIKQIFFLALLTLLQSCVLPTKIPGNDESSFVCNKIKPLIINVRTDTKKKSSCLNHEKASACIANRIQDYYSKNNSSCLKAVDIYMPGTSAEDGNYNQFNSMFNRRNNRAHISIKYENSTLHDRSFYDKSVINGTKALKAVLNAIKEKMPKTQKVRVFGHSKGAHIVSHVSTRYQNDDLFKFWAFAQPGRTKVPITKNKGSFTGPLGQYGYIQKHNNNLVSISWLNDEVKLYTGDKYNGAMVPQAWEYPGYINDKSTRKGNVLDNRIDHHDTYGGDSEKVGKNRLNKDAPYLATGDDSAYGKSVKKRYKPYFWRDRKCRDLAWQAMEASEFTHYIGTSGPRGSNCQPRAAQAVTVKIRYLMQRNNLKNEIDFRLVFDSYNEDGHGQKIAQVNIPRAKKSQKEWQELTVDLQLPDTFNLRIQPIAPKGNNGSNNTIHIAWIKVSNIKDETFKKRKSQFIVGPNNGAFEGQDHQKNLAGANKSGWKKHASDNSNWKLYKSRESAKLPGSKKKKTHETLKFVGDGDDGQEGFYKPVSLLD